MVRERIGAGGMGIVYRVHDRERGMDVALKTLRKLDPRSLYRFKREFRALADVSHRNLVALYELALVQERWFFTMELVEGLNLLTYLRGVEGEEAEATPTTANLGGADTRSRTEDTLTAPSLQEHSGTVAPPVTDYDRLRSALRQLVQGVSALHRSGHLHRDIKPSNVLVTPEGRLVLLDFGVIAELGRRAGSGGELEAVGTAAYMAPEQASPGAMSEAADWYAVGTILYEALVGRRPFRGRFDEILAAKAESAPPPPREANPDIPDELASLCLDLLSLDPDQRPGGQEILRRLESRAESAPIGAAPRAHVASAQAGGFAPKFFGRSQHLDFLRQAYAQTQTGHGLTVYVRGISGIGKSVLVEHFLDEVESSSGAVVIAGRCYQRESVPYKAVDSLVDSLSRFLVTLPEPEADALLPRDVLTLARVFPVLKRVGVVARARQRSAQTVEPLELRRRAFASLRELLARLAERRPLVLFVDDLQWGDVDSAPLLDGLMRPPDAPPLLLLLAFRSEAETHSDIIKALYRRTERLGTAASVRTLDLRALTHEAATDLAAAFLEQGGANTEAADKIAEESGGIPYFAHELARFHQAQSAGSRSPQASLSLEGLIRARVDSLDRPHRAFVETVAVAGRPLTVGVARQSARIDERDLPPAALEELGAGHLLRLTGSSDSDVVEPYHDRVRETVADGLSDQQRTEVHLRIARILRSSAEPDVEALFTHLREAGQTAEAAEYAALAAQQAERALAFDRAAELYRQALELGGPKRDRGLLLKLGDALVNAARAAEAAVIYLDAATDATAAEQLDLRRRAALQYLYAGHVDQGLAELESVLNAVGVSMPRRSLTSLLLRRAALRMRGLRFRPCDETEVTARDLARIDVCWSASAGLGMVDHYLGADFQTRQLLFALRAGEPSRIGRALALEAGYAATAGDRKRTLALLERSQELAERQDTPESLAWVLGAKGLSEYQAGNFRLALEHSLDAARILRSQCLGVGWEQASVELWCVWSLYYLGEIRAMSERVEILGERARERGDLFDDANLRTGIPSAVWLAAGRPERARQEIDVAISRWTPKGFHLQHYYQVLAHAQCDLYTGDGETAYQRITEHWNALRRSLLLRIPSVATEATHLRLRGALAAIDGAASRKRLIRSAERDVRVLERLHTPWARSFAALGRAGIAVARGDRQRAAAAFARAAEVCASGDMRLFEAVARLRQGEMLGGDEGDAIIQEATEWMSQQSIASPRNMADTLAPWPAGTPAGGARR